MILAVDVQYSEGGAYVAGGTFSRWDTQECDGEFISENGFVLKQGTDLKTSSFYVENQSLC